MYIIEGLLDSKNEEWETILILYKKTKRNMHTIPSILFL